MRLLADDVQDTLKDAEIFALDTGALLAGTRFRGDFEERFKAVVKALSARPKAILFIDEIHSTVGAGAVTGGTMDLATMMKPLLTAGDLRVIGSTTFEEFKHIEKDRALARRLQKIAIDEPSIEETVRILAGLRSRYEEHHRVTVHRRGARGRGQAGGAAPARLPPARQRDRSHRRGRRGHAAEGGAGVGERRRRDRRRRRHRADRRADGAHSGAPGVVVGSRAAADARRVARARRLRPARGGAPGGAGDQAIARRAGAARAAGRLLPVHRPDRRRQDRARQAARAAARQRVHPLRHERVHGEARGRAADRRAARIRRLRAGRPARRRRPHASLQRRPARRNREGAPGHLQHPAAGDGSRDADRQHRPEGRLPQRRADPHVECRLARDERRLDRIRATAARTARRRRPSSASSARSSATGSTRSSRSSRSRPRRWRRSSRSSCCSSRAS